MLRSFLTVLLSLLLAIPLTAQGQSSSPSLEQQASAPSLTESDSTAPEASDAEIPESDLWDRTPKPFHDHVVGGVGTVDGSTDAFRRTSTVYRTAPPIRYNRAEGLVLGIDRDPLTLGSTDQARVYGQASYAFGLRDLRYTVGLESQLIRDASHGLKLGVAYQEQTLTPDHWKTSFAENSLAGFGFGYDYFDYYEAEGVSVYAVQHLSHTLRLAGGFRSEMHRPLTKETGWSLFGVESFRDNPAAEPGELRAAFLGLSGGQIHDPDGLPHGAAFSIAATIGEPFGGDLLVNRYEAEGRAFVPLSPDTRLGLRLRGGYATSGAPLQTQFALGGVGSVRSYGQNALRGTQMMLGNVEYIVDGATVLDDVLDDLYVAGLLDAGWVGGPEDSFRADEVLPSAGFSVGLDEREVRLDVTWPLRDGPGSGQGPSIWLRISPNF